MTFGLEDGRSLDMNAGDPQLGYIDRAWASTVHAFQGRTVDKVIAAIEADHPSLTNQKMLYVEVSRAHDRAEIVTDDRAALREQLEAATGERIAALEAVEPERANGREAAPDDGRNTGDGMEPGCAVGRYGRAEDPRTEDPGTRTRPVTRPTWRLLRELSRALREQNQRLVE